MAQRSIKLSKPIYQIEDRLSIEDLGGFVTGLSDIQIAKHIELFPQFNPATKIPRESLKRYAIRETEYRIVLLDMMILFLNHLKFSNGYVKEACKVSGINRTLAFDLRGKVPAFKKIWDEIYEESTDVLEDAAFNRAINGVDEPIYWQGDKVGTKKRYSDSLLNTLLVGRRPDVYKTRVASELSGPDGGPVQLNHTMDLSKLTDDELAFLNRIGEKLQPGISEIGTGQEGQD